MRNEGIRGCCLGIRDMRDEDMVVAHKGAGSMEGRSNKESSISKCIFQAL
jgi:hypothetical protein